MIRNSLYGVLLAKGNIHYIGMQMTDLNLTSHARKSGIVLPAPIAEAGKDGACGLYVALSLHSDFLFLRFDFLFLRKERGKCTKILWISKQFDVFYFLFLFLLPVFFAQMEVESDIYLESPETVVQGEVVAVIIVVLAYEGGACKILSVVIYDARTEQEVEV